MKKMSDNARIVWLWLIFTIGFVIIVLNMIYAQTFTQLNNNPIIFKIEANDNMVKIAEALNNTQTCQPVKCECGNNWGWNNFNNTLYNYSYFNNGIM